MSRTKKRKEEREGGAPRSHSRSLTHSTEDETGPSNSELGRTQGTLRQPETNHCLAPPWLRGPGPPMRDMELVCVCVCMLKPCRWIV